MLDTGYWSLVAGFWSLVSGLCSDAVCVYRPNNIDKLEIIGNLQLE
jgi:hypothetical protein